MPADPAARPGVTEATAENVAQPETTPPSSDRLKRILAAEGISDGDAQEKSVQAKGETDGNQENKNPESLDGSAGSAGVSEEAGGAGGTEPDKDLAAGEGEKEEVTAPPSAEDAAITDEEAKDLPEWVMPRVHKLTRQREEWKEKAAQAAELAQEVATLRERVASSAPVRVAPTPADPLADVTNPEELEGAVQHYKSLLKFATLNPSGKMDVPMIDPATGKAQLDAAGQPVLRDYTAEELAEMRYEADTILREAVPNRARYLQARAAMDKEAREVYPELFAIDPASKQPTPEAQIRATLWKILPEMSRFEDPEIMIGHLIAGLKVHQAKKNAKAPGAGKNGKPVSEELKPFLKQAHVKQAPRLPGTLGSASSARAHGEAVIEKAMERVLEGDGGEQVDVDLVRTLRRSQRPAGAALV